MSLDFSYLSPTLRADLGLHQMFPSVSRENFKKMILEGKILVNSKACRPSYQMQSKDHIALTWSEPQCLPLEPKNLNLKIVYEDEHLAIIDKEAGISVHPSSSDRNENLVQGLLYQLRSLSTINGIERPGIVHRLDKGTSGLLVVAKSDQAHRILSRYFETHAIIRRYQTVVVGKAPFKGTISNFLTRSERQREKFRVAHAGRLAISHFRLLEHLPKNHSLLEFQLETGRTHQIRVHCEYLGLPICNDPVYGPKHSNIQWPLEIQSLFQERPWQFLHSSYMAFQHPINGQKMEFCSKVPLAMEKFILFLKNAPGNIS